MNEGELDEMVAHPACEGCGKKQKPKSLSVAWKTTDPESGEVCWVGFLCQGERSCMAKAPSTNLYDCPLDWFVGRDIRTDLVAQTPAIWIIRLHQQYKPTPESSMAIMERACVIESWIRNHALR